MNKTFVYVLPDTFSTEALYLYDEIFVFVKSVGNLQKKKKTHQNYKRLLPKLHTWTILETTKHFFVLLCLFQVLMFWDFFVIFYSILYSVGQCEICLNLRDLAPLNSYL